LPIEGKDIRRLTV